MLTPYDLTLLSPGLATQAWAPVFLCGVTGTAISLRAFLAAFGLLNSQLGSKGKKLTLPHVTYRKHSEFGK